jgi:CDGSH-type Zn-finger protein
MNPKKSGPKGGPRIKVTRNGPYLFTGGVPLAEEIMVIGEDGEPARWEQGREYPDQETCALCRCGASKNKPFCDGTHIALKFNSRS